jgi:hypothetical protein
LNIELIAQSNRHYETNPDKKRANIWYFGQNAGIDFNTIPPSSLTNGRIDTYEGCSSVCDTSGKLLFYTDGITIWNKAHDTMENGLNLLGHQSSTQSAVIIQHPSNDSLFYVITTPQAFSYNIGMRLTIINIKLNNGLGKVVLKNSLLYNNSSEKVNAVFHSNNKDIWIVGHEYNTNSFYFFLLTKNGFTQCPLIQSIGSSLGPSEFTNQGPIKFSPNGNYLAISHWQNNKTELFNFNKESGKLSLLSSIVSHYPNGLEFNYSSKHLFISQRDSSLIQYRISDGAKKLLFKNLKYKLSSLQITNTNKIFININDSSYLASITNIDSGNPNFTLKEINLSRNNYIGTCNFNQSYFYTPSIDFAYSYDCYLNKIEFEGRDTFYSDSFNWRIKKFYGNSPQFSSIKSPTVSFTDTGLFEIRFIATKGSRSDTVSKQINLLPKIAKGFLGKDTTYRSDIPFSFVLKTPSQSNCIQWQDNSSGETLQVDTAGVYYVKITNKAFCTVSDTIVVTRCDNSIPKPYIFRSNDTLRTKSSEADSLIWFKNGMLLTVTKDTFILLTDTGTYRVEVTKQGYCNKSSDNLTYTCLIGLSIPGLRLSSDTLYASQSQADSFVWYKNGKKLKVTKESFIKLSDTGSYQVEAIKKTYCNRSSTAFKVSKLNTGLLSLSSNNINIYPNPVEEILTIETHSVENFNIRLYDTQGRLILEKRYEGTNTAISLSEFTEGIYLLELNNYQTFFRYKILIR